MNRSIDYPLSGTDIQTILKNKCNVIEYSDLYNIDNLNDAFKNDCIVILYRSSPTSAHWCCVYRNKEGICFFDPYGLVIDSEIDEIKTENPYYANSYYPSKRLIQLILKGNYKHINYNNYKLQEMKSNVNTCGRHVATRLLFKDDTLEEYVKRLSGMKGSNFDEIVLNITNKLF